MKHLIMINNVLIKKLILTGITFNPKFIKMILNLNYGITLIEHINNQNYL
jgi:hypothetical protein